MYKYSRDLQICKFELWKICVVFIWASSRHYKESLITCVTAGLLIWALQYRCSIPCVCGWITQWGCVSWIIYKEKCYMTQLFLIVKKRIRSRTSANTITHAGTGVSKILESTKLREKKTKRSSAAPKHEAKSQHNNKQMGNTTACVGKREQGFVVKNT